LATHAIPQGNGNGALGGLLTDNVFVELGHDLAGRELIEHDLLVFGGSGEIQGHKRKT